MLWFLLFLLVFAGIPAVFIAQNNRSALMDAMAMHERLQRTEPDDPLAKLGPTEFQNAYYRAQKSRGKPLLKWMGLGILAGLFIGFGFSAAISYMLDDPELFVPVWGLALFACMFLGMWRGASKRPDVFSEMRRQF